MKIILLVLSFLICGCSNKHILNINNVQTINYDSMYIMDNDFEQILKEINNLDFKEKQTNGSYNRELKIVSNEKIYNFKLYNDIIFYEDDNKTYVANNINRLKDILKQLEDEYTDLSFFDISYNKCENTNNNLVIKITNTNNCITLNTKKIIYNFKINSIEATEDYYTEDSLLYQRDEIKSNTLAIKIDVLKMPAFSISFDTEYNYTISMLPIQNQDNNKIDYNLSYKQKNRP